MRGFLNLNGYGIITGQEGSGDMAILQTKRLVLRKLRRSDLDDFYEYSSDPNVGPNSGWQPHEDKRHSRFVMRENFLYNNFAWGIIFDNKLIGTVSVDTDRKRMNNRVMSIGYSMSSKFWGKGIMSEAVSGVLEYMFDTYEIDAISVYCYPENSRSRRVIEKCGFEFEGLQYMAQLRYDGKVMDNLCYLLTQEHYNEVRGKLPMFDDVRNESAGNA